MGNDEIHEAGLQNSDHFQTLVYINILANQYRINANKLTKCTECIKDYINKKFKINS